jgi:hypothetical protein
MITDLSARQTFIDRATTATETLGRDLETARRFAVGWGKMFGTTEADAIAMYNDGAKGAINMYESISYSLSNTDWLGMNDAAFAVAVDSFAQLFVALAEAGLTDGTVSVEGLTVQ